DCTVQAKIKGFGVPEIGVYLRSPSTNASGDRYDAVLTSGKQILVRRFRGGAKVVLGQAASGLADLGSFSTLSLEARGNQLIASVNGKIIVQVTDSSSQAILAGGYSGMW